MFQFPTSPHITLCIHVMLTEFFPLPGSPIRISVLLRLFAPSHSFSQLVTSFFGSWCLGILPTLLVAWPLNSPISFDTFDSPFFHLLRRSLSSFILRETHLSLDFSSLMHYPLLFMSSHSSQNLLLFSFQGAHRIKRSLILLKLLRNFSLWSKLSPKSFWSYLRNFSLSIQAFAQILFLGLSAWWR